MRLIDIIVRFSIVFILSFIFGYERQISNKAVGFGTYIFVAVGSCGLSMLAAAINNQNPLPLLSGIITGVGFLGAGALMKTPDKIYGFTTAASIWIFAIFGILTGTGYYEMGMIVYTFIWVVILMDKFFEVKGIGSYRRKIIIKTNKLIQEKEIKQIVRPSFIINSINIDKNNNTMTISYLVETQKKEISDLAKSVQQFDWIASCTIE